MNRTTRRGLTRRVKLSSRVQRRSRSRSRPGFTCPDDPTPMLHFAGRMSDDTPCSPQCPQRCSWLHPVPMCMSDCPLSQVLDPFDPTSERNSCRLSADTYLFNSVCFHATERLQGIALPSQLAGSCTVRDASSALSDRKPLNNA